MKHSLGPVIAGTTEKSGNYVNKLRISIGSLVPRLILLLKTQET